MLRIGESVRGVYCGVLVRWRKHSVARMTDFRLCHFRAFEIVLLDDQDAHQCLIVMLAGTLEAERLRI